MYDRPWTVRPSAQRNLLRLLEQPRLKRMSLRCLLFTSDAGVVRPIQQALAELGMEAKNCPDGADALSQCKTGDFQIVIADWNLPETAQLIAVAKERISRERPLILAVVSDIADTKTALRAGANSTLRRPLEAAQVRDTLDMARDLLRAKESAKASAAAAGASTGAAFAPAANEGDMHLRAGEFLSNARMTPSAQFQVEAEAAVVSDHAEPEEQVKPLVELEPMAAEVGVEDITAQAAPAIAPVVPVRVVEAIEAAKAAREKPKSLEELLKARRHSPPAVAPASKTGELMNFGDMQEGVPAASAGDPAADQAEAQPNPTEERKLASEAALFNYISTGEEKQDEASPAPRAWMRPGILAAILALAAAMAAVKVPPRQWRTNMALLYGMGHDLLNPPVAKPAEVPRGHENFGRAGDEYRMPAVDPIPDATTDPSEIKVVPVVDPTLKTNNAAAQGNTGDASAGTTAPPPAVTENADPKAPAVDATPKPVPDSGAGTGTPNSTPVVATPKRGETDTALAAKSAASVATLSGLGAPNAASPTPQGGIPSSLQSKMAPSDPAPGGVKPVEAALQAIEPVNLPESEARTLLVQVVPPTYPKTVAVNAQRGSVVVAVTLGRDGSVQDAKFMQGSLSFARSAVEAVRQWRFKPYLMNGRPVTVQTVMTLTFSPPA
jgi:periplasmic protein TonB